ncbi:MAG: DNA replication/repair protein RecF [Proteobacteria bacterium]|nr:DNA replication/repair protein RecF [Pseudomonadota bacterium]
MRIERLNLARFRSFTAVEWRPEPGINLITGDNGAGKTSLLEAAHLLAHGRSFRGSVRDGLIQNGQADLEVFAQWGERHGRSRAVGLRHAGREWQARLDGQPSTSLAELCTALAMMTFEPGSHELIAGRSEPRRRFVDWALFHVEPEFLPLWRRYARALRQRNALLKSGEAGALLEAWDQELAQAGEPIARMRALYLQHLAPLLARAMATFVPELGEPKLVHLQGWKRQEQSLLEALERNRARDLAFGHSSVGPHRADWRIDFAGLPSWNALSRGQEKLVALACFFAQGQAYADARGEWPVVALDDLASELDRDHQRRVLLDLAALGAQVLITGTELPTALVDGRVPATRFHVEQGEVRRLV